MTFTEAAEVVLRKVGKPLHYKKITQLAIEQNLLSHIGKTPEVTMSTRLATLTKKDRGDQNILRVGPGIFGLREWGEAPADASQQARLEAELLDNERQLETMGGGEAVMEGELETLKSVLDKPQDYLSIEPRRIRLSSMNVVLDETNTDSGADVDFSVVELKGAMPQRRAFVIGRLARTELPPPQSMNYQEAMRYL